MNSVRDQPGRQALIDKLGGDVTALAMTHYPSTVAEMRRHARTQCNGSPDRFADKLDCCGIAFGICAIVAEAHKHTIFHRLTNQLVDSGNIRPERDDFQGWAENITQAAVPLKSLFTVEEAMLGGMRTAVAVDAEEKTLGMESKAMPADLGAHGQAARWPD